MDKLEALGGLRFTLTHEMEETMLNMLVIQQMLDESEISSRERYYLKNKKRNYLNILKLGFKTTM